MESPIEIVVGDKVRSFDFAHLRDLEGSNAHYIEGIVEEVRQEKQYVPWKSYKIQTTRAVRSGVAVNIFAKYYYPPVNGLSQLLSYTTTNFVEKI